MVDSSLLGVSALDVSASLMFFLFVLPFFSFFPLPKGVIGPSTVCLSGCFWPARE